MPVLCDCYPQVQVAARPILTLDPLAFQSKPGSGPNAGGDSHHQFLDPIAPHEADSLVCAGRGLGSGNDQVVSEIRAFLYRVRISDHPPSHQIKAGFEPTTDGGEQASRSWYLTVVCCER